MNSGNSLQPTIAHTVVYRHPCDCDAASRPLNPEEKPEHRFDVDGQPFPWHMPSEHPVSFRKSGPIYLVTVSMYSLARANMEMLSTLFDADGRPSFLHINGDRWAFPWLLSDDPITLTAGHKNFPPVLRLTFLAEHVDADIDIPEAG